MKILICLFTFIFVLCITLPKEIFSRQKRLQHLLHENRRWIEGVIHYENQIFHSLILFARYTRKILYFKVSNAAKEKIEKNLVYSGLQSKITIEDFIGLQYVSAGVCIVYFGFLYIIHPSFSKFIYALLAVLLGYFFPLEWIKIKAKNRQWAIQKETPSILTSMAIITDAGLNLLQAVEEITKRHHGELAGEFKKTLEDIKIGISQKEAFERLCERCTVEEIHAFVSTIIQAIEKGNSGITVLIRKQAEESWESRKQKAKELAGKASLRLFFPLLLLVFPAFIIFLVGPIIFSIVEMFGK